MKQFEIWDVSFDPSVGREIKKTRPALIVSNNILNRLLKTVIVVPLTSQRYEYIPSRVDTNFRNKGGQIAMDQINCVDKQRLVKKLGMLPSDEVDDITDMLELIFSAKV